MTRLPLALITAALALAACTSGEDAAPGSAATDAATVPTMPVSAAEPPDRGAKLQGLIEAWATENDPVGVAAAARFPDGETWLGGAGLADRERGIPVDPADRFEIASITKTFVSALTLRLAEEGLIRLDEPIGQYLPSFPASDEITVRHLLGHRAGVFDPVSELVSDREGHPTRTRSSSRTSSLRRPPPERRCSHPDRRTTTPTRTTGFSQSCSSAPRAGT